MALLQSTHRRIPLIKLLVARQGCFHLLFDNESNLFITNYSNKFQAIIRHASTTTKKGNALAFNTPELCDPSFSELKQQARQLDLRFEDGKTAFRSKTNFELMRGYLVFQLCGIKFLLDNQKMVYFNFKRFRYS